MELFEVEEEIRYHKKALQQLEAQQRVLYKRKLRSLDQFKNYEDATLFECPIWKDKEGMYHPLIKMSDMYLVNVINYLLRKRSALEQSQTDGLRLMGTMQGEMALDTMESGIEMLGEDITEINLMLETFRSEQLRREGTGTEWDVAWCINADIR